MEDREQLDIDFKELSKEYMNTKILQFAMNCNCNSNMNCNCNANTNCNCGTVTNCITGTKICPIINEVCTYNDCITCPSNPAIKKSFNNCSTGNCNCSTANCNCNC